jgi:RNA-directed DNA polymerase
MPEEALVNTDDPVVGLWFQAERRVREIQTKLHRWATMDAGRRFDDLFNLVCDPAFLLVAWDRVRNNTGGRSPGVDSMTVRDVVLRVGGVEAFLQDIRDSLRARTFHPLPVRERLIPKPGTTKKRRLGIPTVRDRVVQAACKLVLEPIFEADFTPCSYGFRPNRRAQDAIAEIHHYGTSGYHWVLDADIEACFDSIDHAPLMDRVRRRIGDKRVLALVKAFLKAGVLTEFGERGERYTGTPQGGILSPLLANIALSALDEHFFPVPDRVARAKRRRHGLGNYRLIRYADDFVVMVDGTEAHTQALFEEVATVLAPMGLRLSAEKTKVAHLDEGFEFLGFLIQRRRKRGAGSHYIYTFPSKKSIERVEQKMRTLTGRTAQPSPGVMMRSLNQLLRGWCNYFRHGVSKHVFSMLNMLSWRRATRWLRKWHQRVPWRVLRKRYIHHPNRWDVTAEGVTLFRPSKVAVTRYRYRGAQIPTPWSPTRTPTTHVA